MNTRSIFLQRLGYLSLLAVCGWWVHETVTNTSCENHSTRGAALLLHKLCELGGPWVAAIIPALILAALTVGVWFAFRSR